jgi:DNA polymerase-4
MNVPFVLHIDIDAFFAAVEIMLNPALKGKPVIIGGLPDERGVVCTASYEARKYDVHSGMALQTAAKRCPQGIFLRGRYHIYSRISDRFFDCLKGFSPRVEIHSIDEAYIDLSGTKYLSASVYRLGHEIKSAVEREIGLTVSAGLGFSKLGAKLATEAAKPGNFFVLYNERDFITNLSIEKIPGIGPHTLLILRGLGIKTVKQLETAYPSIWRRTIAPHLYPGSGYPVRKEPKTKSFSRETTFPEDISDRELIASHLAYLVSRLSVHLGENKLFAGRIEVKVRFSDFSTYSKRLPLDYPTYSYSSLWKTALHLLNVLSKKKKRPLRLVGVKVEDISNRRDLLPFVSFKGEKLSTGVRDIKKRFGFSSIMTARELLLKEIYPLEREGVVLKTASLTK